MGKPSHGLLKKEDFVELRYTVSARNMTTRADVRPDARISIAELRDDGLSLLLPKDFCAQGHILLVTVVPTDAGANKKKAPAGKVAALVKDAAASAKSARPAPVPSARVIEITAKVRLVQENWDGTLLVQLSHYQVDEKKWKAFLKAFDERQERIHKIVKVVRE